MDNLSILERLPCELFWKIIDETPESVFDLILTSQLLRSRVLEYAHNNRTIHIVDQISLRIHNSTLVQISVYVPEDSSSLFELRLKTGKLTEVVFKREYRQYAERFVYWVEYSPQNISEDVIAGLHECVGAKVESYSYDLCDGIGEHAGQINRQLIEGFQFDKLIVDISTLSKQSAYFILNALKSREITHLSLTYTKLTLNDTVPFLLELSSLTQSMFIDAVACSEYNFGVENGDWASIILDMFSRKLDKLFLFTNLCDTFLPIAGAETLKQTLLQLEKKIWFSATCNTYHSITGEEKWLHIVDPSREQEACE